MCTRVVGSTLHKRRFQLFLEVSCLDLVYTPSRVEDFVGWSRSYFETGPVDRRKGEDPWNQVLRQDTYCDRQVTEYSWRNHVSCYHMLTLALSISVMPNSGPL